MPTPLHSSLYYRPSALRWKSWRTFLLHLRIERKNCANEKSNPFWWHGTANWEDGGSSLVITTSKLKASGHSSFLPQPGRTFPQKRTGASLLQSTHFTQNGIAMRVT